MLLSFRLIIDYLMTTGWLGSRVVSVLDPGTEGLWFKSQS